MSPEREKFFHFLQQLDGIQERRNALEADTYALYGEAAKHIDVLALKAAMKCRHGCLSQDALFSTYRLFSKNMNRSFKRRPTNTPAAKPAEQRAHEAAK